MSEAKKCDICGDFYVCTPDSYECATSAVIGFYDDRLMKDHYDCCPKCWRSIKDHISILKRKKKG